MKANKCFQEAVSSSLRKRQSRLTLIDCWGGFWKEKLNYFTVSHFIFTWNTLELVEFASRWRETKSSQEKFNCCKNVNVIVHSDS